MISTDAFIRSAGALKAYLQSESPAIEDAIEKAYALNPWFIPQFTMTAINSICRQYLDEDKLREWIGQYPSSGKQVDVAIIMAGNVPLVGFHDLLSVLASGHKAVIKLSDKDSFLTKFITDKWIEMEPALSTMIDYTDKLKDYDAVIATGSNNSSRYFEYYFRDKPHILRRNRNGVAVLDGNERAEDLAALMNDIFLYFGLGCRNVSKLYVPEGYDFTEWESAVEPWNYLADHTKYRHNLDYNYAMFIINLIPHLNYGHLVLKQDELIASRIGSVHYSHYHDISSLQIELESKREEIQCVISKEPVANWEHIKPGHSQEPALYNYADGVDTMQFLSSLRK